MQILSIPALSSRRHAGTLRSTRVTAIAALLVGAVCFGLGTVATKGALDGFPPLTLAGARFGIAAVVLTALCRSRGLRPVYDDRAVLLGLTGIAAPYAFQNLGLHDTGAGVATLLIEGGMPMMVAVLGAVVLRERLTGPQRVGMLLGVGGVVVVALNELEADIPLSGMILCLATAAAFAIYTVLGRKIYRDGFSLPVLTGGTTIGAAMLAPLVTIEVGTGAMPSPDAGDLLLVLFLGLVGSAVTQVLWSHGMAHLEAAEIGIFGTFMPVVGIAAAALFLGEAVTTAQLLGILLIASGILVTARGDSFGRPRPIRGSRRPTTVALA